MEVEQVIELSITLIGFLVTLYKVLSLMGDHDAKVQDRLVAIMEKMFTRDFNRDGKIG